jgi:acyl-CoA synthetase (NDP forming)
MSIRTVEDPLFGPVLSFALAGAASDLLDDRSYRIPPVTDVDAAEMIRELKSAPLLFGYRGGPRADLDAVEDLLQRVAALKDDLPEVAEINLEPVLAGQDGYRVLKARARVAQPVDNRRDWYVRRLSTPVGLGDTVAH